MERRRNWLRIYIYIKFELRLKGISDEREEYSLERKKHRTFVNEFIKELKSWNWKKGEERRSSRVMKRLTRAPNFNFSFPRFGRRRRRRRIDSPSPNISLLALDRKPQSNLCKNHPIP